MPGGQLLPEWLDEDVVEAVFLAEDLAEIWPGLDELGARLKYFADREPSHSLPELWLRPGAMMAGMVDRITWDFVDVRKALGVGEHTLRAWMRRTANPIPHVRAGRRVLFDPEDVQVWFREESRRPPQPAVREQVVDVKGREVLPLRPLLPA
jgi:hypothetical protein